MDLVYPVIVTVGVLGYAHLVCMCWSRRRVAWWFVLEPSLGPDQGKPADVTAQSVGAKLILDILQATRLLIAAAVLEDGGSPDSVRLR